MQNKQKVLAFTQYDVLLHRGDPVLPLKRVMDGAKEFMPTPSRNSSRTCVVKTKSTDPEKPPELADSSLPLEYLL